MTRQLVEQFPKILFDLMPIIWIYPIQKEYFEIKDCYMSPLYITSERRGTLSTTGNQFHLNYETNFVMYLFYLRT